MSLGVLIAQIDTSVVNLARQTDRREPSRRCQRAAMGRRRLQSRLREPAAHRGRLSPTSTAGAAFLSSALCCSPPARWCAGWRRTRLCWSSAAASPASARRWKSRRRSPSSPSPIPIRASGRAHWVLWASCNGLAFVIGPTLGGVLVDAAGWRSIFLLIVPICIVALGAGADRRAGIEGSQRPHARRARTGAGDRSARRAVAWRHRRSALGLGVAGTVSRRSRSRWSPPCCSFAWSSADRTPGWCRWRY